MLNLVVCKVTAKLNNERTNYRIPFILYKPATQDLTESNTALKLNYTCHRIRNRNTLVLLCTVPLIVRHELRGRGCRRHTREDKTQGYFPTDMMPVPPKNAGLACWNALWHRTERQVSELGVGRIWRCLVTWNNWTEWRAGLHCTDTADCCFTLFSVL
jgi:hypothetical protein